MQQEISISETASPERANPGRANPGTASQANRPAAASSLHKSRSAERVLALLDTVIAEGTLSLTAAAARGVLRGYRNRYSALYDAVVETEEVFREDLLATENVADLLTLPINVLADRWRTT